MLLQLTLTADEEQSKSGHSLSLYLSLLLWSLQETPKTERNMKEINNSLSPHTSRSGWVTSKAHQDSERCPSPSLQTPNHIRDAALDPHPRPHPLHFTILTLSCHGAVRVTKHYSYTDLIRSVLQTLKTAQMKVSTAVKNAKHNAYLIQTVKYVK